MLRLARTAVPVARAQSRSISRTTEMLAGVDPFTHVRRQRAATRPRAAPTPICPVCPRAPLFPLTPPPPQRASLHPIRPPNAHVNCTQPHGTWDHLKGATENHFSKKMAAFVVGTCVVVGSGTVLSAVAHQNRKHGFTK